MPSRPPSDYMSRLDKSAGVIPSTPGLARRLSMSVTRRNSELTIPQRPSSSIAPTLPRVVIRDFGFPSNDPRHTGEGQPVQATPPVRNSSGFWGPPGTRTPTGSGLTSWDELAGADSALVSSASSSTFSWGFITSHAEAEAVDEISESMDEDDAEPADVRCLLGSKRQRRRLIRCTAGSDTGGRRAVCCDVRLRARGQSGNAA